jgi:hypothetical protein
MLGKLSTTLAMLSTLLGFFFFFFFLYFVFEIGFFKKISTHFYSFLQSTQADSTFGSSFLIPHCSGHKSSHHNTQVCDTRYGNNSITSCHPRVSGLCCYGQGSPRFTFLGTPGWQVFQPR